MNIGTTLVFYLLLGGAVAVATYLSFHEASRGQLWFQTLTAVVFWPLYLPALLQRSASNTAAVDETAESNELIRNGVVNADEMAAAIAKVETELDLALTSLGGWSDAVLARERHRFEELRVAWHAQAAKVRELDQVLSKLVVAEPATCPVAPDASDRVATSLRARQTNVSRLRAIRDRYRTDLMNTLAWVRELVTTIHLAKYTGAPASRTEEIVMQIATSIEGLSEVATWRDADCAASHSLSIFTADAVRLQSAADAQEV